MNLQILGKFLKQKRQDNDLTSAQTADKLNVNAPYYSRLENGKEKPSLKLLDKLASFYGLPLEDKQLLEQLAGFATASRSASNNTETGIPANPIQARINLDPQKLLVLFSDTAFITVSDNGVVFDFGQKVASFNEQHIVSRVGMSIRHAEKFRDLLIEQIKKAKESGIEN